MLKANIRHFLVRIILGSLLGQSTAAFAESNDHAGLWIGSLKLCRDNIFSSHFDRDEMAPHYMVSIVLDSKAQAALAAQTENLVGKNLPITLDGVVVMNPVVNEPLRSGTLSIYWFSEAAVGNAKSAIAGEC